MKDNNKLLTIGAIISVIVLVLAVAFCTYKMIFNNNTNVQENNKAENNNKKKKELIADGYELVDLNTSLTTRDDLDLILNQISEYTYDGENLLYVRENNDKIIFQEGMEDEITIGIENNMFYVSFLNKVKYYSNVNNVSKIYIKSLGCEGGFLIFLLTKEGDIYTILNADNNYDNIYSEIREYYTNNNITQLQSYLNGFTKLNQNIKYINVKEWNIQSTTCENVYYLIGETENGEEYIIENEDKYDYMTSVGKLFVKNDNKIYVDKKYTNLDLKYYMYNYIIANDNYLYEVNKFEKVNSKKVKELYRKAEDEKINFIVIYVDNTMENLEVLLPV